MIQRIQSIYLLLSVMFSTSSVFVFNPWKMSENRAYALDLLTHQVFFLRLITVFSILSALIAFLSIFQYKKRKLQVLLVRSIIIINLFLVGLSVYLFLDIKGEISFWMCIGIFTPTVLIVLSLMAKKAITKDEDLVKSIDRLR